MSCFMTGGPGKEHGTNKPPPTGRVQERSKGDTTCPTTSQNPSLWYPSWLNKACMGGASRNSTGFGAMEEGLVSGATLAIVGAEGPGSPCQLDSSHERAASGAEPAWVTVRDTPYSPTGLLPAKTLVNRPEKPADSKHSSTSCLSPRE